MPLHFPQVTVTFLNLSKANSDRNAQDGEGSTNEAQKGRELQRRMRGIQGRTRGRQEEWERREILLPAKSIHKVILPMMCNVYTILYTTLCKPEMPCNLHTILKIHGILLTNIHSRGSRWEKIVGHTNTYPHELRRKHPWEFVTPWLRMQINHLCADRCVYITDSTILQCTCEAQSYKIVQSYSICGLTFSSPAPLLRLIKSWRPLS